MSHKPNMEYGAKEYYFYNNIHFLLDREVVYFQKYPYHLSNERLQNAECHRIL